MTKYVLLNNVDHKDLKIVTKKSADFGDNVMNCLTFPTEFRDVLAEYPIFFTKHVEEGYQAVALFGFEKGENLFLDKSGWHASYIPAIVNRQPFLIGFQKEQRGEGEGRAPVIHVDMDSPRISKDEGVPVFLEHGGNTPYIERVGRMLMNIHEGIAASKAMFAIFEELALIEPFTLEVALDDGVDHKLIGYYTLNEEKLNALAGKELEKLSQSGFLMSAYLIVASMVNIKKLIAKKNETLK